ncbi:zinc finger protein 184-like [Drosophila santomea]|uniref:zinc finger protein 184-like n=1 Tax=Drosophila santomea TaxID=129105 RepID=UPI00195492A8|nr:zinc finger protein 184-like [Drosophila santomea]
MEKDAVCRVCLQQEGDMINIFDGAQDPGISIADMISRWSGYQVKKGDSLPETICPTCLEDARVTFGFIQGFEEEGIYKVVKCEKSRIEKQLEDTKEVEVPLIAQKYLVKHEPVDDEVFLETGGNASNDPFEKGICKIEVDDANQSRLPSSISLDLDTSPIVPDLPSRGRRRYKCSMCTKSFAEPSQFSQHILTHSGDDADSQESKFSGSDFSNSEEDNYEEDDYNHPSESDMPAQKHQDKRCQISNPSRTLLKRTLNQANIKPKSDLHAAQPYRTTYMPYKCNYCPKFLKDKDSYRLHLRSHEKRYKCSQCPKTFANSKQHKKHILSHSKDSSDRPKCPRSDVAARAFKCPKCPKTFPFSSSCSRHLLSHAQTRPYQCPECPNSYARPYALRAHVLSHSEERSHKCEQCSKSFRHKHHLNEHKLTHSDKKLHTCSQCEKSFTYASGLSRHILLHNGEKPHKCEFCSKSFSRASDLKIHTRIHTGEKPYRCAHCKKYFSVLTNMARHQRKCHS